MRVHSRTGTDAGAPRTVEADDHGHPHLRQHPGAEAGTEPARVLWAVVGPVAIGREVGRRGREEEEAAGNYNRNATVERAAAR